MKSDNERIIDLIDARISEYKADGLKSLTAEQKDELRWLSKHRAHLEEWVIEREIGPDPRSPSGLRVLDGTSIPPGAEWISVGELKEPPSAEEVLAHMRRDDAAKAAHLGSTNNKAPADASEWRKTEWEWELFFRSIRSRLAVSATLADGATFTVSPGHYLFVLEVPCA